MEKLSTDSNEQVNSLQEKIHNLLESSGIIVEENQNITNAIFMALVKLDHLLFKSNGYKTVFRNQVDGHFASDTECRLGQWYHSGIGKENFSKTSSYSKLTTPHKEVHENIKAEKASNSVTEVLNAILKEEKIARFEAK